MEQLNIGGDLEPRQARPPRKRNLPFDALQSACSIDTRNAGQLGRLTRALKEIRGYFTEEVAGVDCTPEEFDIALAKAITVRARLYRQRFPRVELTPNALSMWWHQVAIPTGGGRVITDLDRVAARQLPNPLKGGPSGATEG